MLSAVDAQGEAVVLAGPEAKALATRLKEIPHFCPQCESPVIVKAGEINIPHFAHVSSTSCDSFSEPESPRHLAGKSDLFQWITQSAEAQMEARLPDQSQRPDILTGRIAVEFQCSSIPASLFKERTDKYTAKNLTPFWIYGGKAVERKGTYIKLSPFQRLFLRYNAQLGFYFISYCPDQRMFTIFEHIMPLTPSLCTASCRFLEVEDMTFPPSIPYKAATPFPLQAFFNEKRRWIDQSLYFQQGRNHPFFKAVYASGRNPYLLPECVGLPVPSGMSIRSHPIEWQFYLLAEQHKRPVEDIIRARIKAGHLKEQPLPLAPDVTPEAAAAEYMALINELGISNAAADSSTMFHKLQKEEQFMHAFGEKLISRLMF